MRQISAQNEERNFESRYETNAKFIVTVRGDTSSESLPAEASVGVLRTVRRGIMASSRRFLRKFCMF